MFSVPRAAIERRVNFHALKAGFTISRSFGLAAGSTKVAQRYCLSRNPKTSDFKFSGFPF